LFELEQTDAKHQQGGSMERREIEKLAYKIYENSGQAEGRELNNWLEAERLLTLQEARDEAKENEKIDEREYQEV
jgi:hypothetical protein